MFATWLRNALKRPGLSQRGLARHLELDPQQISRMVKGKRKPQIDELNKIAAYVGEWPPQLAGREATAQPTAIGVRGSIMEYAWKEAAAPVDKTRTVSGIDHPDFPTSIQYAMEIVPERPNEFGAREYIIAVSADYVRRELMTGDIVHAQRRRGDLKQDAVLRVIRAGTSINLARVETGEIAPGGSNAWEVCGLILARMVLYRRG